MKAPRRCIDIGLSQGYKGHLGMLVELNEKEQAKENEKLHRELHKSHTVHIHLDGTLDENV